MTYKLHLKILKGTLQNTYLKGRHCWGSESLNYTNLEGRAMQREVKKEPEQRGR